MSTQPLLTPAERAAAEVIRTEIYGGTSEEVTAWARAVVAAVRPIVEDPYARTVAKLATALDGLGSRIYRDLAGEYAEIHTGDASEVVDGFNAAAEEFLAVLNDPEVRSVVDTALSRPTSKEH